MTTVVSKKNLFPPKRKENEKRRSQRKGFNWEEFQELLKRFPLRRPRIVKGYRWIYAANL